MDVGGQIFGDRDLNHLHRCGNRDNPALVDAASFKGQQQRTAQRRCPQDQAGSLTRLVALFVKLRLQLAIAASPAAAFFPDPGIGFIILRRLPSSKV